MCFASEAPRESMLYLLSRKRLFDELIWLFNIVWLEFCMRNPKEFAWATKKSCQELLSSLKASSNL